MVFTWASICSGMGDGRRYGGALRPGPQLRIDTFHRLGHSFEDGRLMKPCPVCELILRYPVKGRGGEFCDMLPFTITKR